MSSEINVFKLLKCQLNGFFIFKIIPYLTNQELIVIENQLSDTLKKAEMQIKSLQVISKIEDLVYKSKREELYNIIDSIKKISIAIKQILI